MIATLTIASLVVTSLKNSRIRDGGRDVLLDSEINVTHELRSQESRQIRSLATLNARYAPLLAPPPSNPPRAHAHAHKSPCPPVVRACFSGALSQTLGRVRFAVEPRFRLSHASLSACTSAPPGAYHIVPPSGSTPSARG